MPSAIAQLGLQTASNAIGAGMGLLLGSINDRRQLRQQEKLQELQMKGQKEMTDFNYGRQLQMWKDTNYAAQVEELKKAGLNPGLLYGTSGGGATTTGSPTGTPTGASAQQNPGEVQQIIGLQLQNQLQRAQIELLEAQTNRTNVQATKESGVDTENVRADTQNKILDQVIKNYTGKELKETFEQIKQPHRQQESDTYQRELQARQGIADNIFHLWENNALWDKSNAEIEQLLINNSKSREETKNIIKNFDILEENLKGAKLENIIKELETKLQTQTGIDKNSPTWLKILGRLFIGLTTK